MHQVTKCVAGATGESTRKFIEVPLRMPARKLRLVSRNCAAFTFPDIQLFRLAARRLIAIWRSHGADRPK
jgi:hypothetical protein